MGYDNIFLVDEFGKQTKMLGDNLYGGAPVTIDVEHHEIHCGDSFIATRSVDLTNAAADTIIVVPNETGTPRKLYHMVVDINTEGESNFEIYEDATTVADGTPIVSYNRDRNSILTSALAITHTPNTPAAGTLIFTEHWGSGKDSGAQAR